MYSAENETFESNESPKSPIAQVTFSEPLSNSDQSNSSSNSLNKGGIRRVQSTPNHFERLRDREDENENELG